MCLYPTLARNKKYEKNKKNGGNVPVPVDGRTLWVVYECNNCIECRERKANEWRIRLLEDIRHNKNGIFVTLTFNTESLKELSEGIKETGYERDNKIAKIAVRRFLERWRKKNKKSVRHWLVTELGHKNTEHLHLHGIIWTDKPEDIEKIWKYGYVWKGYEKNGRIENYVSERTVNYIVKYIHKTDADHKYYKPKVLTSAGIGRGYMTRTDKERNKFNGEKTIETYKTRSGHDMTLPKYFRNKIYSDDEREKLWIQKLDKEVTYICGIEIDISKGFDRYFNVMKTQRKINRELGYGSNWKNPKEVETENQKRDRIMYERIKELTPSG